MNVLATSVEEAEIAGYSEAHAEFAALEGVARSPSILGALVRRHGLGPAAATQIFAVLETHAVVFDLCARSISDVPIDSRACAVLSLGLVLVAVHFLHKHIQEVPLHSLGIGYAVEEEVGDNLCCSPFSFVSVFRVQRSLERS